MKSYELIYDKICFLKIFNNQENSCINETLLKELYNCKCKIDTIDQDNIYFTGSTAIEQIFSFLKNPISARDIIPKLKNDNFCLMTFHPVTLKSENIGALMDYTIELILNRDTDIVITYPNNDVGSDDIQKIIRNWIFKCSSCSRIKYPIKYNFFNIR